MHGAWHGAWCWRNWLDYLPSLGYEVHAISLPGHGASSMERGHINRYTFADYLDVFADALAGVSPAPVVVGHSLGGAIVQKYLERATLPAAVLLAPVPASGMIANIVRSGRAHPLISLKQVLTRNLYHSVATPKLAAEMLLGPSATAEQAAELHSHLVRESFSLSALMSRFATLNSRPSPVLVLSAERDAVFTLAEHRATAEKYSARLQIFKGQGHDLMLEPAWREVADTVDRWMSEELKLP